MTNVILEPNSKRLKHELHFPAEQVQRIRVQPPPMALKPKKVPVLLGTLAHLLFRQQVIFCNKSSRLRVSKPKGQVAFRFISPTSRLQVGSPTSHLACGSVRQQVISPTGQFCLQTGAHHPEPPYQLYPWVNPVLYLFIFITEIRG